MSEKLTNCKTCNKEIAANAKVCPHCGAKVKKPFYKKWWFITLCVIVVISAIASSGSDTETTPGANTPAVTENKSVEYTAVDLGTMLDELKSNALKAENTYKGTYVEFVGVISNIDSSGSYISVVKKNDDSFGWNSVMCYIKNDTQLNTVMEKSVGDQVTIRGKVKSVGEVLGYSVDMDSIE